MTKCFGEGKCIQKREYGYYKPFKCPFNCKIKLCPTCNNHHEPEWQLEKNDGKCRECLRVKYNELMMSKVFGCKCF